MRKRMHENNTVLKKQLEECARALQSSEERFRNVIHKSADGVVIVDRAGSIIFVNPAAESLFGRTASKLLGSPFGFPVVAGETTELEIILPAGITVAEMRAVETEWEGNRAYLAALRDITERKQAEEALRESETRLHSIANTALDAVVLIDNDGNVSFWNDAAARMFGYTNEEIIGKYLHDYIMPERHIDAFKKGFDKFRITGEGPFIGIVYEIEAKRKDGTEFPVELSLSALRLKGRWNAIGIVREISERKRTEESLKKTLEELERSNKELQQFAYVVSHDLQEPLRTVASFVDLLAEKYKGKLDEKADKYISFTVGGVNRMAALIDDLLAYSRVAMRGKQFVRVETASVLAKARENLKKAIEESKASISSDVMPSVFGDETQLVQLLQNLVGNAIKFRKKDVQLRIHISAERRGNEWVFGVHDNGIGIEPRFHERVFTIFQRLHTREEYPGTGVGLAICRKIVERHGGRIWLESKPGEGSTFYFTVPGRG